MTTFYQVYGRSYKTHLALTADSRYALCGYGDYLSYEHRDRGRCEFTGGDDKLLCQRCAKIARKHGFDEYLEQRKARLQKRAEFARRQAKFRHWLSRDWETRGAPDHRDYTATLARAHVVHRLGIPVREQVLHETSRELGEITNTMLVSHGVDLGPFAHSN